MKILKLIGLLLDYPDESLWAHQEELLALAVRQHQRRCRDDVQPYYLHPIAGGKR